MGVGSKVNSVHGNKKRRNFIPVVLHLKSSICNISTDKDEVLRRFKSHIISKGLKQQRIQIIFANSEQQAIN